MIAQSGKVCFICERNLPLECFHLDRRFPGRRKSKCINCERERDRQLRAQHKRDGHPVQTPRHHSPVDPAKYVARYMTKAAIRSGRLVRPGACDVCGLACRPDSHHDDYNRPLEIRWLCESCHKKVHRKEDPAAAFCPSCQRLKERVEQLQQALARKED
jgi:hypothetical protein